jgi:murein DD-endopeptidase MepM/ murein hydrolase activator NlpD
MKVNNNKKIFSRKTFLSFLIITFVGVLGFLITQNNFVFANEEVNQLNQQISEKERELQRINAEIRKLEASANNANQRSQSLQNTISGLEASAKKITTDIQETELEIEKTNLTLSKLEREIDDKENLIESNSDALAKSIRLMNSLESVSIIERFLGYNNISEFWSDFEQTQKIQKTLHTEVETLTDLYNELQQKEKDEYLQKQELSSYKTELASEQVSVEYTQKEKAKILQQTKNEEAAYQKILDEKKRQREAFEQELLEIESKLQYLIDPDSYPNPRNGILEWPVDSVYITQQFGGTAFAATNPGVYGRPFHPGTDFGIPIGTRVKSIAPGVVIGYGNTDAYPGCNAWGKWIVVEHDNGLTSLYAHLSSISISNGQRVNVGETIGLSGNTGFSTGPHLHLTLYASQGVKIGKYGDFKAGTGCSATAASGPFADLDAYLDPMTYLPSL